MADARYRAQLVADEAKTKIEAEQATKQEQIRSDREVNLEQIRADAILKQEQLEADRKKARLAVAAKARLDLYESTAAVSGSVSAHTATTRVSHAVAPVTTTEATATEGSTAIIDAIITAIDAITVPHVRLPIIKLLLSECRDAVIVSHTTSNLSMASSLDTLRCARRWKLIPLQMISPIRTVNLCEELPLAGRTGHLAEIGGRRPHVGRTGPPPTSGPDGPPCPPGARRAT